MTSLRDTIASTKSEADEQRMLVKWLRARRIAFFAVPNHLAPSVKQLTAAARKAVKAEMAKHVRRQKAIGLLPGAPDLVLIKRDKYGRPVVVEMKARGGEVSDEQQVAHDALEREGWVVVVGWGYDDAVRQLERLGY